MWHFSIVIISKNPKLKNMIEKKVIDRNIQCGTQFMIMVVKIMYSYLTSVLILRKCNCTLVIKFSKHVDLYKTEVIQFIYFQSLNNLQN